MSNAVLEKIAGSVEELRGQMAALSERIAALEQPREAGGASAAPLAASREVVPAVAAEPPPEVEAFSPEILLAISAAVAAFLGKRAHVRAVRLLGSTRWSQEGRVSIQASHRLQRV